MRSRTLREGSVGLLVIVGVVLFGGLILWLRGINPGARSYTLEVELPDAGGIEVGSPVRFRGVKVGNVTAIKTASKGLSMLATINSGDLLIPKDAIAETTQSGFIGQVYLDFRPPTAVSVGITAEGLTPFAPSCDPKLILCDGDRVQGKVGAGLDQLIKSTTKLAELVDSSNVVGNANQALKDVSTAAKGVNKLTVDARKQIGSFSVAANSVTKAADEVTDVIKVNRGTVTSTLNNLDDAGAELKLAINNLSPFISRLEKGKLLDNLETMGENGAKASANLRDFSATLNNPITVLGLAQTLDSARVTFINAQKITTDLEQVTGDATFRANLVKLVNGLSKLVSSGKNLEKQVKTIKSSKGKQKQNSEPLSDLIEPSNIPKGPRQ
jgi:phospholipid/cholesterol/gamma-HCH transport system substrate-binding protein